MKKHKEVLCVARKSHQMKLPNLKISSNTTTNNVYSPIDSDDNGKIFSFNLV